VKTRELILGSMVALVCLWWPPSVGEASVVNGGFDAGSFSGWNLFTTPDGSLAVGPPVVVPYDVAGNGNLSNSARFQVGLTGGWPVPGGGGIAQAVPFALGIHKVTVDIASEYAQPGGTCQPV